MVALGIVDALTREVESVGIFRPLIKGGDSPDQILSTLVHQPVVHEEYDEAYGVTYDDVRADPEAALSTIVDLEDSVAAVDAALRTDVPVPLFTGGTLRTGLATAVPRHVVLVTRATTSGWRVFEPSRGEVLELRRDELASPGPRTALGGWSVPAWVLLPR